MIGTLNCLFPPTIGSKNLSYNKISRVPVIPQHKRDLFFNKSACSVHVKTDIFVKTLKQVAAARTKEMVKDISRFFFIEKSPSIRSKLWHPLIGSFRSLSDSSGGFIQPCPSAGQISAWDGPGNNCSFFRIRGKERARDLLCGKVRAALSVRGERRHFRRAAAFVFTAPRPGGPKGRGGAVLRRLCNLI